MRCTRESLAQHQEKIVELKGSISEKESQLSEVQEAMKEKTDELQQKVRSSFVKKNYKFYWVWHSMSTAHFSL